MTDDAIARGRSDGHVRVIGLVPVPVVRERREEDAAARAAVDDAVEAVGDDEPVAVETRAYVGGVPVEAVAEPVGRDGAAERGVLVERVGGVGVVERRGFRPHARAVRVRGDGQRDVRDVSRGVVVRLVPVAVTEADEPGDGSRRWTRRDGRNEAGDEQEGDDGGCDTGGGHVRHREPR